MKKVLNEQQYSFLTIDLLSLAFEQHGPAASSIYYRDIGGFPGYPII